MRKIILLLIILLATATPALALDFFNGFETDIEGWFTPERVPSGTDGISSSSGDYHAKATVDFTRWGAYTSEFPSNGYITRIDIYLDVDAGLSNDIRFDFASAINKTDSSHLRDFVFNGGFYNDDDGSPGSGSNRFIFSASNAAGRSNSSPKNPGREPIAVTETGWYTFQHKFYDNCSGVLAVDLSIIKKDGTVIHTWMLSDSTDIIGAPVGGNRYGWFAANEFSYLAIDNTEKFDVDAAGITVTPTSGLVTTEGGGTATFTVVLTSQPTANVSIGVSSDDTTEGTVAPAALTFTSANWNSAQTVTVTGVDDAVVDGNMAYTINIAAATSTDCNYNGIDPNNVSVTNNDDDTVPVGSIPTLSEWGMIILGLLMAGIAVKFLRRRNDMTV